MIFLPLSLPPYLPPYFSPFLPPSLPVFLPLSFRPPFPPFLSPSLPPSFPPFTLFTLSQGPKARISAIYFPLIPLVLDHVTRLDPGAKLYISPMLNATSMALFTSASGDGARSPSVLDSMPSSATGSECLQPHSHAFPSLIPMPFPASFADLPWFQFLITFVIPFHYVSWVCRALCTCVSIFCFLVPHLPAMRSTDDR